MLLAPDIIVDDDERSVNLGHLAILPLRGPWGVRRRFVEACSVTSVFSRGRAVSSYDLSP